MTYGDWMSEEIREIIHVLGDPVAIEVLGYLREEHGLKTPHEIADATGHSWESVAGAIDRLAKAGLVDRMMLRGGYVYVVISTLGIHVVDNIPHILIPPHILSRWRFEELERKIERLTRDVGRVERDLARLMERLEQGYPLGGRWRREEATRGEDAGGDVL